MDFLHWAERIWGEVRLAQDPLSPSRSRGPIAKLLEAMIVEAELHVRDLKLELLALRKRVQESAREDEWTDGTPIDDGVYVVLIGRDPAICMRWLDGFWVDQHQPAVRLKVDSTQPIKWKRVRMPKGRRVK